MAKRFQDAAIHWIRADPEWALQGRGIVAATDMAQYAALRHDSLDEQASRHDWSRRRRSMVARGGEIDNAFWNTGYVGTQLPLGRPFHYVYRPKCGRSGDRSKEQCGAGDPGRYLGIVGLQPAVIGLQLSRACRPQLNETVVIGGLVLLGALGFFCGGLLVFFSGGSRSWILCSVGLWLLGGLALFSLLREPQPGRWPHCHYARPNQAAQNDGYSPSCSRNV